MKLQTKVSQLLFIAHSLYQLFVSSCFPCLSYSENTKVSSEKSLCFCCAPADYWYIMKVIPPAEAVIIYLVCINYRSGEACTWTFWNDWNASDVWHYSLFGFSAASLDSGKIQDFQVKRSLLVLIFLFNRTIFWLPQLGQDSLVLREQYALSSRWEWLGGWVVLKVICNGFSQNWWKVVSSCFLQCKPVCVINFDKLRSKMLKSRSLVVSLV